MFTAFWRSQRGFPAPNPHVGCVLVREGKVVGKGWHEYAGGPHAEIVALKEAGERAFGATAYVTLEPCDHQGRTGPCTQALIRAGVAKVIFAVSDPNPQAKGGAETLREAGIEVSKVQGFLSLKATNRQFLYTLHTNRPFVTIKAAISLDGRIALASGESKWITSLEARVDAQKLRAYRGAVLVGRKTAEQDRARLTVRDFGVHNKPLRIALDPRGVLPKDLPIFDDQAPFLRFTHAPERDHDEPFTDLPALLHNLWQRDVRGLLVEGGATTVTSFIEANLVDEIVLYQAPKLLGNGPIWLNDFGLTGLKDAPEFIHQDTETIGPDLKITLYSRNLSNFLASI